jgi:hypothetical protein
MLKDHEKFLAFMALLIALVTVAWLAADETTQGSALRDVLIGMIAVLGTAAQGLFRVSETAGQMNDILNSAIDKLGNSQPAKGSADVPKDAKEAAGQVAEAGADAAAALGAIPSKPDFTTFDKGE